MGAHEHTNPQSISAATEYPVGLTFEAAREAFAVRITTLPNDELRFHIEEGAYARTETVKIVTTVVRPGLFIVSWVENGGGTVVHVQDFAQGALYCYATLADGAFHRMEAPLRVVSAEVVRKFGFSLVSPDEGSVQAAVKRAASSNVDALDYDALLQANLTRVFGERDADRRLLAIRELYAEDAVLNEPHTTAIGHLAICEAVTALLETLPPNFIFTAVRPAVGHHGIGRLEWRSGPSGGPLAATGTDIAVCEDGRIRSLFVFVDPPG